MAIIGFVTFVILLIQFANLNLDEDYKGVTTDRDGTEPLYAFMAFLITVVCLFAFGPPFAPTLITAACFFCMLPSKGNPMVIDQIEKIVLMATLFGVCVEFFLNGIFHGH